jgi:hypothetical protein
MSDVGRDPHVDIEDVEPICHECGAKIEATVWESPLEATLTHYEEAHRASWLE